jgi:hypothetical protein
MQQPEPLTRLEAAYAAGDFAELRRLARRLTTEAGTPADSVAAARAWSVRVGVDRSAVALLGFALLLFCVIVVRYVL